MDFFKECTPGFIEELVISLEPRLCLPNYKVIIEGEVGQEMYFISKGICHVRMCGNIINVLNDGDYFGEIALLLSSRRRTASVTSAHYCDFFYLTREDF